MTYGDIVDMLKSIKGVMTVNESKRKGHSRKRINKDYTRMDMKDTKVRLLEKDLQAFKKKCAHNNTSMQRVLESYIKQYIEGSE